jgi:hypothetical protein
MAMITYPAGMEAIGILFVLGLWALGLYILYWIIRKAVRHGIEDADYQRWKRRTDGRSW